MTLHTGRLLALLFFALPFVFTSCENENISSQDKGKVMLSLYSDIVLKSVAPISDVEDFNFRFVGVDQYGSSEYYRYGDVQWPFEWYFGVFKLQAESCTLDEAEAGYGRLRYEGLSQQFAVVNDRVASASVVCQVANVNVKVAFDDSMFESFADFKLVVDTVEPSLTEEGELDLSSGYEVVRTLEFDSINQSGYYNLSDSPVLLHYTLCLKTDGAEEFVESRSGFFMDSNNSLPAVLKGGDVVTLRVKYTGVPIVTPGVKFIISGERTSVNNGVLLNDYANQDGAVEDE